MKSLLGEFFGDALKITAMILLCVLAAGFGFWLARTTAANFGHLVELARQIPAKTAAFFGFLLFFLWTTICSQCVINAQTRAAKQVWALMLYVAVWVLLVIHLQAQGLHL